MRVGSVTLKELWENYNKYYICNDCGRLNDRDSECWQCLSNNLRPATYIDVQNIQEELEEIYGDEAWTVAIDC